MTLAFGFLASFGFFALSVLGFDDEFLHEGFGLAQTYDSQHAAADARPGECYTAFSLRAARAERVDCAEPHGQEVYWREPSGDGDEYPRRIEDIAEDTCMSEFEPYVESSWMDSSLEYNAWVPSEEAWDSGERDIVCSVEAWGETLEESVAGSGR